MYKLKMNISAVKKAKGILSGLKDDWMRIDKEISELSPVTLKTHGEDGMKTREALLRSYDERKDSLSAKALEAIAREEREYQMFLVRQTRLNSEDLLNADMRLFDENLIETEDELRVLSEVHRDSEVFRRKVETYAKKNNWVTHSGDVFLNVTNEKGIKEYGETFFRLCKDACRNPVSSYSAFYINNESALNMLAVECGVSDIAE